MKKFNTPVETARELRKSMTESEKILWKNLRNRRLEGFKFLRQHPITYDYNANPVKYFVADFYCAERKLIVELDGKIHLSQQEKDFIRDVILLQRGYKTLRIENEEMCDVESVLRKIATILKG